MTQAGHRTASVSRMFSLGVGACWLLLCGLQFGWGARYAWAYNLWQYLPVVLVAGLFALSLLLCFPFFRGGVRRALQRAIAYLEPVPGVKWLGLVAVLCCSGYFENGSFMVIRIFCFGRRQKVRGSFFPI